MEIEGNLFRNETEVFHVLLSWKNIEVDVGKLIGCENNKNIRNVLFLEQRQVLRWVIDQIR